MAQFEHDRIVPDAMSRLGKKEQVAGMFNDIAPRYDFLNRLLSLGIDKSWRNKAIKILTKRRPETMLDVATGTADMAVLAAKKLPALVIEGIDISEGMLEIGRKKTAKEGLTDRIHLSVGDSENIDFPDNRFDAITVAFGVRNFAQLETGLKEMLRVLKPGGRLIIVEFSRPTNRFFRWIYHFYMQVVTPNAGGIFSNNKKAYRYLNDSVMAFPEREKLVEILKSCGYQQPVFTALTFGICCIYEAGK